MDEAGPLSRAPEAKAAAFWKPALVFVLLCAVVALAWWGLARFEYRATGPAILIAALGLALSFLAAATMRLHQKAAAEAARAAAAILALEEEVRERKRTEDKLEHALSHLDMATKAGGIGVWSWEIATDRLIWNEPMYKLYGVPSDFVPSYKSWSSSIHPDDRPAAEALIACAVEGKAVFRTEFRVVHCTGTVRHLGAAAGISKDEDGRPQRMVGISWDLTESKDAEARLRHLATHDVLTDLPGTRLVRDRLSMALAQARRSQSVAAIMFMDLDGFKDVNDRLGHDAGDFVLQQIARRLLGCVRETDTIARIGGDEFLFIVSGLGDRKDAARIAEKALAAVSEPVSFNGKQVLVGASIGISLFPDQGEDIDRLIKEADEAMYRIKKKGKSGYTFACAKAPGKLC
jgi:diguanylate cyclase (GGDEF)-like protein/PAS domain S-box-containing protein